VLVSARDVRFEVEWIDDIAAPLDVHAERLIASGGGWLYGFRVEAEGRLLAAGRVAVLPAPNANLPPG
jgi:predicted hotdog family 3-hydroxylacyl-ACP dehydratase